MKFALLGALAYSLGYGIFLALGYGLGNWLPWLGRYPVHVMTVIKYTAAGFLAIVAGGLLGWFWGGQGKEKMPLASAGGPHPAEKLAVL